MALNRGQIDRREFVARARELAEKKADQRAAELTPDLKFRINDPRSLGELPEWRKPLMESDNEMSREIGQRLEALQNGRQAGGSDAKFMADADELAQYLIDQRSKIPVQHYNRASADLGLQCTRFSEQTERGAFHFEITQEGIERLRQHFRSLRELAPTNSPMDAQSPATGSAPSGGTIALGRLRLFFRAEPVHQTGRRSGHP